MPMFTKNGRNFYKNSWNFPKKIRVFDNWDLEVVRPKKPGKRVRINSILKSCYIVEIRRVLIKSMFKVGRILDATVLCSLFKCSNLKRDSQLI